MVMESEMEVYTAYDYLINKVKFEVPKKTMFGIMLTRSIQPESLMCDCDADVLSLAYADTLKWFCLGPRKVNNTSDSDNGWSHTGGGYEISGDDISAMKAEANAIYQKLEPDSMLKKKSTFRLTSHGVKRANYSPCGEPLTHIIK